MSALIGVVAAAAGVGGGYLARHMLGKSSANTVEQKAIAVLEQAERDVNSLKKEGELKNKEETIRLREEFEKSVESRKTEISSLEERIEQKEINLDRKVGLIEKKEKNIEEKSEQIESRAATIDEEKQRLLRLVEEESVKLQQVAGLSEKEARKVLFERMEKELHSEMGALIRRAQDHAKESADSASRKILSEAIQRNASSHASEIMTSTVPLPSDDMKGRIIGRDGRNIRSLEALTGVNILIDDTPEAVVISGFDPVRRETARQALTQLISDGRIHPARIEEIVGSVEESMAETIRLAGEDACFKCGQQGIDPEILRMMGRLMFRTSYTQNVLKHAIEVSNLMGIMAGELNMDVSLAKRIGLFHDIGKAMDHEVEGGHAIIGADLLKRHNEKAVVVNAVAAHHEEVPAESVYAILASAADTVSSSRLGARAETTDIYIKRLEKLEAIANDFEGVTKTYAIHAGREVRVLVQPENITDDTAMVLARDISKKIEADLKYPGQIRVTVIRETRCVEYAK
jgi:ribonuclease Y